MIANRRDISTSVQPVLPKAMSANSGFARELRDAAGTRELIQPDHCDSPIQRVRTALKLFPANRFHRRDAARLYPIGKVKFNFDDCNDFSGWTPGFDFSEHEWIRPSREEDTSLCR